MNKTLSIIIPSFNRYDKLITLLSGLRRRLSSRVSLTVLDNGSTDVRYLTELPVWIGAEFEPGRISLIRRNANYAMEGNMIRCYEIADSDWLWMIGDDETPAENMNIEAILALLDSFDPVQVAGCVFSSNIGAASPIGNGMLQGLGEALIKARLSALLLLSTTIFSVPLTRRYMREAVHACHTACPHVAAILMALKAGAALNVSSLAPLRWNSSMDKEDIHGDVYEKNGGLALKVSRLLELPLDRPEKALLFEALARCYCSVDILLRGVYGSEPASMMARQRLLIPYVVDALRFERRVSSRIGAFLALGACLHGSFVPLFMRLRQIVKKVSPRRRRHPSILY